VGDRGLRHFRFYWDRVSRYSFGLRHAVDADHIAAIDNVTASSCRKGNVRSPLGSCSRSGIRRLFCWDRWASPGHAGAAAPYVCGQRNRRRRRHGAFHSVLFALRRSTWWFCIPFGGRSSEFAPASRTSTRILILCSATEGFWRDCSPDVPDDHAELHMYPLGVLFGLGFDTATEIGSWDFGCRSFEGAAVLVDSDISGAVAAACR